MQYSATRIFFFFFLSLCCSNYLLAQKADAKKAHNLIYVDTGGVMRWTKDDKEASFFGVNYTTPFAFAYRAHKALYINHEQAIKQDVYHMARLGFDAFRVHVWDTEISDKEGNLLDNDHLHLFDFLITELKKRNIKTIITPIAFWGNGYPEQDEDTPGFSRYYGRAKLTTNDSAIVAQENYLKQFFQHVNPYTKLSYQNDPDIIAVEINNEPSHSGPKEGVTKYINRLATSIKNTGFSKPIFYNISQGPYYGDAVAASNVNGFSFQWYPTGLVSGSELRGNYLPNVDKYTIPFDSISAFKKKALMVYEFDAADVMQSCMYPAMAKSFRQAGFQWATQFAYDPLALAHANTEYQTHYLNLAYTPSKAISMLIASRVFHQLPRLKNFGLYPQDSVFNEFRVSYKNSLSEMNTEKEFYYSNSTITKPVNVNKLEHLAGVGGSQIVKYNGFGAYFLDRVEQGIWRLEVMPDAIAIRDPFEKASPKKEVTRIQWRQNQMEINIPELGPIFEVSPLNDNNSYATHASTSKFEILPGTYLLIGSNRKYSNAASKIGVIGMKEFVAPKPFSNDVYVYHNPIKEVTSNKAFTIHATIVGMDSGSVSLQINQLGGRGMTIPMLRKSSYDYAAEVPVELLEPGMLNYRVIIKRDDEYLVFPGSVKGNPFSWDNINSEAWETFVADKNGRLELFNPNSDRAIKAYPTYQRGFRIQYITGKIPKQLILRMSITDLSNSKLIGFQYSFIDQIKGRLSEITSFKQLVINARSTTGSVSAKVTLILSDATAVSAPIMLSDDFKDFKISLSNFKPDAALLMPRPYPGFLPLTFETNKKESLIDFSQIEKVEVTIGHGISASEIKEPCSLEISGIWLNKDQ